MALFLDADEHRLELARSRALPGPVLHEYEGFERASAFDVPMSVFETCLPALTHVSFTGLRQLPVGLLALLGTAAFQRRPDWHCSFSRSTWSQRSDTGVLMAPPQWERVFAAALRPWKGYSRCLDVGCLPTVYELPPAIADVVIETGMPITYITCVSLDQQLSVLILNGMMIVDEGRQVAQ